MRWFPEALYPQPFTARFDAGTPPPPAVSTRDCRVGFLGCLAVRHRIELRRLFRPRSATPMNELAVVSAVSVQG